MSKDNNIEQESPNREEQSNPYIDPVVIISDTAVKNVGDIILPDCPNNEYSEH